MVLFDRLGGILCLVRGGALPDPETDPERLRSPPRVTFLYSLPPEGLASAHQSGGPLELLERQEPESVAHEDRDPALAGAAGDGALQTPEPHSVSGEAEVSLRLSATGREPQEVRNGPAVVATLRVVKIGEAG